MDSNTIDFEPGAEAGDFSLPEVNPTYGDLIAYFYAHDAVEMDSQQVRNRVSALRTLQQHVGASEGGRVGQELGAEFLPTLTRILDVAKDNGKTAGSLANLKSYLRQWEVVWQNLLTTNAAPKFTCASEAIAYYIERAQRSDPSVTLAKLDRLAGFSKNYLSMVMLKNITSPRLTMLGAFANLEKLLDTPPGIFTGFINKERAVLTSRKLATKATAIGKRSSAFYARPYGLKPEEVSAMLKAEVMAFVRFKSDISPAPLKRNQPWVLKPKSEFSMEASEWPLVSPNGKTFCPTASILWDHLTSFFGALRSLGDDPQKFSLAYLADFTQIKRYLDFMRERAGQLTETSAGILIRSKSLLLEKVGFLRQQSIYASRLPIPIPAADWEAWCVEQLLFISELENDLHKGNHIKQGRNPQEPIVSYLERQHPVTVLFELSDAMQAYFEQNAGLMALRDRIAFERDLLLIDILPVQPLRIKMFRIMTYLQDNTGNLYKRQNGQWAIRFKPEDFKNEKGAAQKLYDVPLPASLTPKIEHYLQNVRPLFNGDGDHVFTTVKTDVRPVDRATKALTHAFRTRTRQFLPGCAGFGPHAPRHLVATDYIKNNPNGYQVAADVLHDKLETVLAAYAHLRAADGHRFYQEYLDKVQDAWRKAA